MDISEILQKLKDPNARSVIEKDFIKRVTLNERPPIIGDEFEDRYCSCLKIMASSSLNPRFISAAACLITKIGNYERATEVLVRKTTQTNIDHDDDHEALGHLYYIQKDFINTIRSFAAIESREPLDVSLLVLASTINATNTTKVDHKEVKELLSPLYGTNSLASLIVGLTYVNSDQVAQGMLFINHAISLANNHPEYLQYKQQAQNWTNGKKIEIPLVETEHSITGILRKIYHFE